jgi:hypothetical protein
MRVFEFRAGEVTDATHRVTIIDLDTIVMFEEILLPGNNYIPNQTSWVITLSSRSVQVTKSAFDRILLAWKSK